MVTAQCCGRTSGSLNLRPRAYYLFIYLPVLLFLSSLFSRCSCPPSSGGKGHGVTFLGPSQWCSETVLGPNSQPVGFVVGLTAGGVFFLHYSLGDGTGPPHFVVSEQDLSGSTGAGSLQELVTHMYRSALLATSHAQHLTCGTGGGHLPIVRCYFLSCMSLLVPFCILCAMRCSNRPRCPSVPQLGRTPGPSGRQGRTGGTPSELLGGSSSGYITKNVALS